MLKPIPPDSIFARWAFSSLEDAAAALQQLATEATPLSFGITGREGSPVAGREGDAEGFDMDDAGATLTLELGCRTRSGETWVVTYVAEAEPAEATRRSFARRWNAGLKDAQCSFSPHAFEDIPTQDLEKKPLQGEAYEWGDTVPLAAGSPA